MSDPPTPRRFSGHRLRTHRDANRLTPRDLGERVGVSRQAIEAYENGTATPAANRLPDLAAALGVPIDDLFEPELVG